VGLAVHIVGSKSKDEEIVLTETNAAIVDDVAERYIKEYFFLHLILNYLINLRMN